MASAQVNMVFTYLHAGNIREQHGMKMFEAIFLSLELYFFLPFNWHHICDIPFVLSGRDGIRMIS